VFVMESLRLVAAPGLEELELETPRFTVRFRRGDAPIMPRVERQGQALTEGLVDVTAPMVGTFYSAPAPGEAPYVEVGTAVEPDTQVCILEVMKLMSAVVAGVGGTIAEICRANGEPVQYGDVLFRIAP
jgi:acetyl-CoA carboxylase biotin carboxyl carrier protein